MTREKWIAVLITFLFVVSFPAFSSGSKTQAAAPKEPLNFLTWDAGGVDWNNPDLWSVKRMSEVVGRPVKVVPIAGGGFQEKFGTMLASDSIGDINVINLRNPHDFAKEYGSKGFFLPFDQYMGKLPELKRFFDKGPYLYNDLRAPDGHMYGLPMILTAVRVNRGMSIRGDLLKKYNIPQSQLDTWDGLYEALKTLTRGEETPAWIGRRVPTDPSLSVMWHTNGDPGAAYIGYDYKIKKYTFGPASANFKNLVTFVKRALDEGVLDPEIFTTGEERWRQLLSTGKGLFTIDNFSTVGPIAELADQPGPPEFVAILPPKAPDDGTRKNLIVSDTLLGWATSRAALINAKTELLDDALKLANWLYSDRGSTEMFFGPEGDGWKMGDDGVRQWFIGVHPQGRKNPDEGMHAYNWGSMLILRTCWVMTSEIMNYTWRDWEGERYLDAAEVVDFYNNAGVMTDPVPTLLPFTQEELEEKANITAPLSTFAEEQLGLFLLGKRPMSEWDAFVKEAQAMKLDRLLEIWNGALKRWEG